MFKQVIWNISHPIIRLIEGAHLIQILPRDRILSATSINGDDFEVDRGIRIDVHDRFGSDMLYRCALIQSERLHFMFYNGGYYQKGAWKNQIIRVESANGLEWTNPKRILFSGDKIRNYVSDVLVQFVIKVNECKYFLYGTYWKDYPSVVRYESQDGLYWEKVKPHICIPNALDPFILKINNGYVMYYSAFNKLWEIDSPDRINWNKPIILPLPKMNRWRNRVSSPSVVYFNDYWHLYFHGADNDSPVGLAIWHAVSKDRKKWDFLDSPVLEPGCSRWAGDGVAWPHPVIMPDGKLRLYFTAYWGKAIFTFITQKSYLENK